MPGIAGTNGLDNFTTVTAISGFVIPAALANVTFTVGSSQMLALLEYLFISDGTNFGHFKVVSKPTTTSVQVQFLGYTGDTAAGNTIASGALIVPAIQNPVPVAAGGTNATTAAGARTNLGVAASGSNSDITSLSALATALSVAQGGTGSTTVAGALAALGLPTQFKTGTFTANGTTAVVVANAFVTANSTIVWTYKSGTAPTVALVVSAISAGVSFSIKSTAADSALYNYVVIN